MLKCSIYIRVQKLNVERIKIEKDTLIEYANNQGWNITSIHIDQVSANCNIREGLNNLLNDAKEHKFDIILCNDISRITRKTEFLYNFIKTLEENCIHFVTKDGAMTTLNDDKALLFFSNLLYECEHTLKIDKRRNKTYTNVNNHTTSSNKGDVIKC